MTTFAEKEHCPTCGADVKVISSDEGTCYYEPVQSEEIRGLKNEVKRFKEYADMLNVALSDSVNELSRIKEGRMKLPVYITAREIRCYSVQDIDNLLEGE